MSRSLHPLSTDGQLTYQDVGDMSLIIENRDQPTSHAALAFGAAEKVHSAIQQQPRHEVPAWCGNACGTVWDITLHGSGAGARRHRDIGFIHTGNQTAINAA